MRLDRRRRLRCGVAIVAASLLAALGSGCGGGADTDTRAVSSSTSSRGGTALSATDAPPPIPPISDGELQRRVDAAVGTSSPGDPCPLYDVVATVVPDISDATVARRSYRIIGAALARIEARADLAGAWQTLREATGREAESGGGGAAFASAEVHRALDLLDAACGGR